jgi:transcription antitermination factor NusG
MGGKTERVQAAAAEGGRASGRRWFVVVCQPGREREAKTRLKDQGFEVYLPMRLNHPRAKRPISPFLPRYLFARFDPTIDQWLSICSTVGVSDVIRSGVGYPLAVRDAEILKIMGLERDGVIEMLGAVKPPAFRPGDVVTVKDGHLAGYQGLVHLANDNDRVIVFLALVARGESVKVELSGRDLEKSQASGRRP